LAPDFPPPKTESQLSAYCPLEPTRTIVTAIFLQCGSDLLRPFSPRPLPASVPLTF
jgi:hypothetical protein